MAANLEDARAWVSDSYVHADLMLIDLVRKTPEKAVRIGRELREHAKYDGNIPLIVMPEKVPNELEGMDVNVSEND